MHTPLVEEHRWFSSILRGHYGHFGMPHNGPALNGFLRLWRDNLDERRATIRMRIVSRSVMMIVAARQERKAFNLVERRSG
jgi:hypothetical protein